MSDKWRNNMLDISEMIFSIIFILEFFLKIVGMGFILEPGSYMRDGWNLFDFVVVISSILSFLPGSVNFSAIRTLRIMRPLKSINSVKGIRILVISLIEALPDLGNVVVFLFFIIVLFGILGMQLFGGVFENRCRLTNVPVNGTW
jgi:hypothetical protein